MRILGFTLAGLAPFIVCGALSTCQPPATPRADLIKKLAALREYPEAGIDPESDRDAVAVLNWAIEKARNVNH